MSERKSLSEGKIPLIDKIIAKYPYVLGIVFFATILSYFGTFNGSFGDQAAFGAFGDFFGGILNPLLTFFTILLLLRQLQYQRSELHATVNELKATAKIHKENINHNRAVHIYEKTNEEFEQCIARTIDVSQNAFAYISPDGVMTEPSQMPPPPRRKEYFGLELSNLTKYKELLTENVLYTPQAGLLFYPLVETLGQYIVRANNVLLYIKEYEQLGVNKLLYLNSVKSFIIRLKKIEKTIEAIDIESEIGAMLGELKKVIIDCEKLVERIETSQT